MKNRMFGFLAIVVASLVSFFGFTSEARADFSDTTSIFGSYSLGGFNVSYAAYEGSQWGEVVLNISSNTHSLMHGSVHQWTDFEAPERLNISIFGSGFLNNAPNQNSTGLYNSLQVGGVSLAQVVQTDHWDANQYGPEGNSFYASLRINPVDLSSAYLIYNEFTDSFYPGQTLFTFNLRAHGTFSDPSLGMPFRAVPTPGATALFGLSGLALLRRLRRR